MKKFFEKLLKSFLKEYLKESLKVSVSREGYDEQLLMVSVVLDGEEIDSDSVNIKY